MHNVNDLFLFVLLMSSCIMCLLFCSPVWWSVSLFLWITASFKQAVSLTVSCPFSYNVFFHGDLYQLFVLWFLCGDQYAFCCEFQQTVSGWHGNWRHSFWWQCRRAAQLDCNQWKSGRQAQQHGTGCLEPYRRQILYGLFSRNVGGAPKHFLILL